jgi:uncharacterized protein
VSLPAAQAAANGAVLVLLVRELKPDGQCHERTRWQHGPIDIVLDMHGAIEQVSAAKAALWARFPMLLSELAVELPDLRKDCRALVEEKLQGNVAKRMFQAVRPFQDEFITPMAAVAGSVAQELLDIAKRFELSKVLINNGGDIALFSETNEKVSIKLLAPVGMLEFVSHEFQEFGVATSGWSGRSFSRGIADAVTVVAKSAAQADAAATMIANAVGPTLIHREIQRQPAEQLKDNSDLGPILVTTKVGALPRLLVKEALLEGKRYAESLLNRGLILSASLSLQADSVIVNSTVLASHQFKLSLLD